MTWVLLGSELLLLVGWLLRPDEGYRSTVGPR
jgi:hypothetical protein